jgi:NhaP-type Na+/H+ or K+/H+ antiporter
MANKFPMNDPRIIWQNQPMEPFKMSADDLRRKAKQRQTKDRYAALLSMAIGLFLCVVFARTFVRVDELIPRLGWALLSLWCIYFVYQANKWIWPGRLAPDATASTSLQFYRRELEKRRDYGRHVWRRAGLTLCFLGMGMIVVPGLIKSLQAPRLLLHAVPFFVLLAIWFAIFFAMRKRNQQKLQQEIDELRMLERENRS